MAARERKLPLHLPVVLGVGTGLYAVALAGVTALQAHADAALAAERQPLSAAVASVSGRRQALERQLQATVSSLNAAATAYDAVRGHSVALETALGTLAAQVTAATGAAASLPSHVSLPAAVGTVSSVTTAPATQATTGASGKP
jgi:phage shock protein A